MEKIDKAWLFVTVTAVIFCVSLLVLGGGQQDIEITLRIPAAKAQTYAKYFLMVYPNETLGDAEPLTTKQWIKHKLKRMAIEVYEMGVQLEHEQNSPTTDPNIVE